MDPAAQSSSNGLKGHPPPRKPRRAGVSFDNLVALANYDERIRSRAVIAKKMVWRDKGEPAKELDNLYDVAEHAARGAFRAFTLGFWMRGGLNLVLALVRLRKTKKEHRFRLLRLALFGSDSLSTATMLGSFVAIYKFLLNALPILLPTSSLPRDSLFHLPKTPGAPSPDLEGGHTAGLITDSSVTPGGTSAVKDEGRSSVAQPGKLSLQAQVHQIWIRKKTRRWQAVLAGAIAGGIAITFEKKNRRLGVAQQMFVRGLQGSWNAYSTRRGFTFPHGDVAVFSLSCAYIMYSYLMAPERLDRGYNNWIQQASHIPAETVLINRSLVRDGKFDLTPLDKIIARDDVTPNNLTELLAIRDRATQAIPDYGVRYSQCPTVHPMTDSCMHVPLHRFLVVAKWMMPVYAALSLVPMIAFRPRLFAKNPSSMLMKGVLNTLRSSAFLGAFVTYYQTYYCFKHWLHSILIKHTSLPQSFVDILISKASFWFGGIIAGLSIFIEKPQRRGELAMYVLPKGLETLWVTAQGHGWVMRTGNYGDILLTAMGMGMVMSTYQNDPHHLSGFVRRIMYQFVGPN